VVPIELDHAISVNTYSTLAATAGILRVRVVGSLNDSFYRIIVDRVEKTGTADCRLAGARLRIRSGSATGAATYFWLADQVWKLSEARLSLGRGVSHQKLRWATGSFRHGPQRNGCSRPRASGFGSLVSERATRPGSGARSKETGCLGDANRARCSSGCPAILFFQVQTRRPLCSF